MATGCNVVVGPATCLSSMAADLGMTSETQMGLFLGLPFWGLGTVSPFSGWLSERLGYRRLLATSSLLQTVGLLVVAAAETQIQAFAGILVTGMGRGLPAAPLNALLTALFPDNRTAVMNVFHAFFYIGMVLITGMILLFFLLGLEWRAVYVAFGAMSLIFGVAAFFVRFPSAMAAADSGRPDLRAVIRQPVFGWLVLAIFFSAVTEIGPSTWLPYYIEKAAGSTQSLGVLSLMLLAVTMAVGRLFCAVVVRRVGVVAVFTASALVSALSIGLAALPVSTLFTVVWLTVLGLAITVSYPTVVAYAGDRFPAANASMFALLNATAHIGGVMGPAIIGVTADAVGLRPAMGAVAVAPLLLLLSLRRTFNR